MIVNPLSLAPDDTPRIVVEVAIVLALYVFPALFLLVCAAMSASRIERAPYFSYLCAFAAPGCLSLSIATANSPLSALAFFVAFPVCPILSIINVSRVRPDRNTSLWHRAAQWASVLSASLVLVFVGWAFVDSIISRSNA